MKKNHLLLLAFMLTASLSFAQNSALQSFIEEHKKSPDFSYAYLSKDLFEVAIKTDIKGDDWAKINNIVKNLGSLIILAADSIDNAPSLYKEVSSMLSTDEYDELLTVRDGQDNVRILTKDDTDAITDLVLLVGSADEFVLVTFAGRLELGNITQLAQLLDADNVQQIAQTTNALTVEFAVSPNPGNGLFNIEYSDQEDPPSMVTVIDQSGKQIASRRLSDAVVQEIDLQELLTGIYWLQLKTAKGRVGIAQVQIVRQ